MGRYAPAEEMLSAAREGRMAHGNLFTGPAGTGKRTLAALCAQTLLCKGTELRPCGSCPPCLRVLSGNHPDIIHIEPENSIGVDAIRALQDQIAVRTYEGGWRIVIIHQADKMTIQAQNAFLKGLEEPPPQTAFFLLADSTSALLQTIISRCRIMRFRLMSSEDATAVLTKRGIAPERAELLAEIAQGSVGQALEINESEEYWNLRKRVSDALRALSGPGSVAAAAMILRDDRDRARKVFDILECWGRARLLAEDGGREIPQGDMPNLHSSAFTSGADVLQSIIRARKRLASNVSWQSALELLFFDLIGG